jgi:DNA-binding XRE family transcriptional regulator
MKIDIKISDKFSPSDAEALNSVVRLLFNIREEKVIAKITSMMKNGWTTISLTEVSNGERTGLCACPGKVRNILTDWYFVYIGGDRYQFQTQQARTRLFTVFGQSLKSVRMEEGLTQTELGNLLGAKRSYISQIEHGQLPLSLGQIERIARVLNVEATIIIRKVNNND